MRPCHADLKLPHYTLLADVCIYTMYADQHIHLCMCVCVCMYVYNGADGYDEQSCCFSLFVYGRGTVVTILRKLLHRGTQFCSLRVDIQSQAPHFKRH